MNGDDEALLGTIAFDVFGTHEVSYWEDGSLEIIDELYQCTNDQEMDHIRLNQEEAYWLRDWLNTHLPPRP